MLIDQNRVPVGVHRDEAGGARRALIRLVHQLHALCLQLALQLAHVGERGQLLGVLSQPGLKVRMFLSNMP